MTVHELLDLLHRSVNVLHDAAQFYNGNNTFASAARAKLNRHGRDPFHATFLSYLSLLKSILHGQLADINLHGVNIENVVLDTLEVLNSLVNDVPQDLATSGLRFPGLHHLENQYRKSKKDRRKVKALGHRKYLFRPHRKLRVQLNDQLRYLCDELQSIPQASEDHTQSLLSEIENVEEWKLPPSLTRYSERLHNLLSHYWRCDCPEKHDEPKVAFFGQSNHMSEDIIGLYKICFARSTTIWHTADLSLMAAGTSNPTIVKHKQPKANRGHKSARFASDVDKPQNDTWDAVKSLCDLYMAKGIPCSLRIGDAMIEKNTSTASRCSLANPLISLQDSFTTQKQHSMGGVSRKDRIVLGVVLCYSYLYLCHTPWWRSGPNIWFASENSHEGKLLARQPFLAFVTHDLPVTSFKMEAYMNKNRPSLPALGKLLLEIWKGSEVTWNELEATIEECRQDDTGEYWLCAINACLGADEVLKSTGSLLEKQDVRSVYVLKVIKSLQWLLEKVCRISMADAIGMVTQTTSIGDSRQQASVTSRLDHERSEVNSLCLHDDGQGWEKANKEHAVAAEVWQGLLLTKVHPFILETTNADPVRIAIIDTGISFDKKTTFMYRSRLAGLRTWIDGGSNGLPTAPDSDDDGHGTHTASTLLQVDPFCSIYVAKVFEGRNETTGHIMEEEIQERVANAIKYCVHEWNVDIISMSFGFDEHVDSINAAISEAEANNILVLAAASNCGGNSDASWPARHPTVISISATNGYGNKYPRNPTPQNGEDNFATLGMEVKAWWKPGQMAHRSGTSVATPIAAGIASLTLHFLRGAKSRYLAAYDMDERIFDARLKRLQSYAAMRKVLQEMSREREDYNYIEPWKLLSADRGKPNTVADLLLKMIKKA